MLIGAMNHPQRDPLPEIQWMAEIGLGFVDLTLEPPGAASWKVDIPAIKAALQHYGLQVVGHTAFYLPMASPFEEVRQAALTEFRRCLHAFAALGSPWMNIHPDRSIPLHERSFWIERNLQSLRELLPLARELGVGLMIENLPGSFNTVEQLGELLDPLPELGLHLDIGHSNLLVTANSAPALIRHYGDRLRHVHLHDNKGGSADLHLPLGTGTVDFQGAVKLLKASGYDATITLEVFSEDRRYLTFSRDVLQQTWDAAE